MCIVISCLTSWRPEEIDVYETLRLKKKKYDENIRQVTIWPSETRLITSRKT